MSKPTIAAIILTKNEEIHIERCIRNAQKYADEIFVVDSNSTDRTRKMAEKLGAKVFVHSWEYHAKQMNWALENLPIQTEWVWRQDADEYLTDELIAEIKDTLATAPDDVNGFSAPCLRKFMGREIKHGIIPLILLRLFRYGKCRCEDKLMDEHMYLTDGVIASLKAPFYDDNLNGLTWWTNKHNGYATREAVDLLMTEYGLLEQNGDSSHLGNHTAAVRRRKLRYIRMPLFFRAFLFFVLRYFFRLGFLDGKEGFLWHFLQGFWYRTLADAKVFEIKKRFNFNDDEIRKWLKNNYLTSIRGGYCLTLNRVAAISAPAFLRKEVRCAA